MPRSEDARAWPAWMLAAWAVGVLGLYAARMVEARPAAVDTALRVLGLR